MIEKSSRDAPRPVGKFEIHEATDYVDMACWTRILAIAVADIPLYAIKEESSIRVSSPTKSPSKEKDQSFILTLHDKLYKLHGRIREYLALTFCKPFFDSAPSEDTRAAHLDRSRTKAIIFQTTFRILYQYQAVTRYRKRNNHGIQTYFRKK